MDQKPTLTDEALLERYYASKDNHWLGVLLERYTLLLFGVAMKYVKEEQEAKDIVQQVFVKVLEELEKYRVTHFKAWLFTIVRNQCLMKLRSEAQKPISLADTQDLTIEEGITTEVKYLEELNIDRLQEALTALKAPQRECIRLFYLEKLSYQQITERTGYSHQEVKSYIQNGKRNLKIWLSQKGGNND